MTSLPSSRPGRREADLPMQARPLGFAQGDE